MIKTGKLEWLIINILFAPIHEVIIHSPDHHKSFDELPLFQSELVFKTYRQRFQAHQDKGQVYIFTITERLGERVCRIRIVNWQLSRISYT